ncbi:MAG: TlpA family protein disulfide reductase [Flavobacteriaceae bacterium]|nr:TlpA family protein disulfide reductase [Flavobacteriaceae bacterium]
MNIRKHFRFKNILFIVIISLFLIPTSKEWILGKISLSPTIISVDDRDIFTDYNWGILDLQGQYYDFSNNEGKLTIISFWATWCPPCRAELPSFQRLYDQYKDKVSFVFVSNENNEVLKKFLKENNYNIPVYTQDSRSRNSYFDKVSSIPHTFLIGKNGSVIVSEVGASDWDSDSFKEVLNKLIEN